MTKPDNKPKQEHDPLPSLMGSFVLSVLVHCLLLVLIPILSLCGGSEDPVAEVVEDKEESVQIVEEEEEPVVAQKSPANTDRIPKKETKPTQPELRQPEEPSIPKEKKAQPKREMQQANKIFIEQPKVDQESEPPPDARTLSAQNRKVLMETQPRERALEARPDAPKDPKVKPDPADKKKPPKPEDRSELPKESKKKGRETAPKKKPEKAQDKVKVKKEKPEPRAPSKERQAQRKGDAGNKGGAKAKSAEVSETPPGPEGTTSGSPRPEETTTGDQAKTGEAGEGAKVDVEAALRIDPGRYQEVFGARDATARQRIKGKPRRMLGRWEKRVAAMKASLENFVPNVRYGNQIAINSKRSAYATYIARIHRQVHRLWGNGYLRQLDLNYGAGHPLSNPKLYTKIEFVIDSKTGVVEQAIIVDTSGNNMYDTEAVRISLSTGPHGPAPEPITSNDGKVYLHWRYWRDTRQCGTFGVSVFVLDKTGNLDTYKVRKSIDDLNKEHPEGSRPHRHKKNGPKLK